MTDNLFGRPLSRLTNCRLFLRNREQLFLARLNRAAEFFEKCFHDVDGILLCCGDDISNKCPEKLWRRGDCRRGDTETRRHNSTNSLSRSCVRVSATSCHRVSASPCLRLSISPSPNRFLRTFL